MLAVDQLSLERVHGKHEAWKSLEKKKRRSKHCWQFLRKTKLGEFLDRKNV